MGKDRYVRVSFEDSYDSLYLLGNSKILVSRKELCVRKIIGRGKEVETYPLSSNLTFKWLLEVVGALAFFGLSVQGCSQPGARNDIQMEAPEAVATSAGGFWS